MSKTKKLIIGLIICFIVLFAVNIGTASATDYYVRTDGNNNCNGLYNNGGTSGNCAWATIQHAANTMVAGDTCRVQSGMYNEQVRPVNSGTAANPITFLGDGMPTVTHTGVGWGDGVFHIDSDYISIMGFNISAYSCAGVYADYGSNAMGLNVSNNYIWTDKEPGVHLHSNAGSHSVISHNEIHTEYRPGIEARAGIHTDILISYNDIYADEHSLHQNWTDASGIWVSGGEVNNIVVVYNKILHAGYTGIKIGGSNCKINYNEIGPMGYVHNGIELNPDNSEIIGNYIHDTDSSWAMYENAIYCPGTNLQENLLIKDNIVENASGRALTVGGHQRNILIENFTATNFSGIGIDVLGFESPTYPVELYTSDNIMIVDADINIAPNNACPITIISLGTKLSSGGWDWNDVTFINPKITGSYTRSTWWLTNQIGYEVNHHFDGTVYVINSNKDDVLMGIKVGNLLVKMPVLC